MKSYKDKYHALLPFGIYASEYTYIFESLTDMLDKNSKKIMITSGMAEDYLRCVLNLKNEIEALKLEHETYIRELKKRLPTINF